ncbi:MAG: hypothetical protein ABGY11_02280 [Candidatus Thioglobus sp.]|jgi:hypothetical protein
MKKEYEASELLEELEKRKTWKRWKVDPKAFIEESLMIYPKDADKGLIHLKVNKAQEVVVDEYIKQMKEIGYVRMIISKYRQAGFSTISSALIFHRTLFFKNTRAVIISLDKPTTESIFSMSKTFWENLPENIKPKLGVSNKREMVFKENDSKFRLFTAGADNPGRGTTNTALLCDETAFFQNADKVMAGLFQSVALTKGSIIIINSTSNGAQGVYYDLWNKAEKGEGNFTPLFVPWYLQDEYRLKCPDNVELTPDEVRLKERWALDNEQIFWRRIKIAETSTAMFKQEYPFTAEESFLQSGSSVFSKETLDRYVPYDPESVREYNDDYSAFDESSEGNLSLWQAPKRDMKYLIGADVALGVKGDYSVATVMTKDREVVAIYRSNRTDPVRYGKILFYLGRWFNNALICPEANSIGVATVQQLFGMNYPNIYQQRKTANTVPDSINHLGFKTTSATRAPIISNLRRMIEDEDIAIPSSLIIEELRNFIITPNGKAEASVGHHDDMVMSLAITCEAYRTHGHSLTNQTFSWGEINSQYQTPDTKWL